MTISKPTLVEVTHEYRFIRAHSYNHHDGEFETSRIADLVGEFVYHYTLNAVIKNSNSSKAQVSVIDLLNKNWQELLEFKDNLGQAGNSLGKEDSSRVKVPLCNVYLEIKQFGDCLGFKLVDGGGNKHEEATSLFDKLIADKALLRIRPFIKERQVISPCWLDDVVEQLTMMQRYVPDVDWHIEKSEKLTFSLHKDYVDGRDGVEAGMYHDIPVYMKVLDGREKSDQVWRKGALEGIGTKLTFSREANCSPLVQFSVRMHSPADFLHMASSEIDYCHEQYYHRDLVSIILGGLEARHLASIVTRNPLSWRVKPRSSAEHS